MTRRLLTAALILAVLAVLLWRGLPWRIARWWTRPPHHYAVTDLGDIAGHCSTAFAINASDDVVGQGFLLDGKTSHALRWKAGTMTDLGTLPNMASSGARAINDAGLIVGWSGSDSTHGHAFSMTGSSMTDLGILPGDIASIATGVNQSGQIVGSSCDSGGRCRPFIYSGGTMAGLPVFGSVNGSAAGINSKGQIVGSAFFSATNEEHAFAYTAPAITDLRPLLGIFSQSTAISSGGDVVGASSDAAGSGGGYAFLYSGGVVTNLGTLGGAYAYAEAINTSVQVVGLSLDGTTEPWGGPATRAFIATKSGMWSLTDLIPPSPSWALNVAYGVNDAGHIVGWGMVNQGRPDQGCHAFLLTPTD